MCSSAAEILPNLWLGNIKASRNRDFIRSANINCIVNCTKNYDFDTEAILPDTKKIRIAVSDTGTPEANKAMADILDRAVTYIHKRLVCGDRVLVHCYAGKQRSPAIVVAFIMKYCEWSFKESLEAVQKSWKDACPDHYLDALTH